MIIRKATEEDVEQIAEIVVEDWKKAYVGIIDKGWLDSMSVESQCQKEINRVHKCTVAVEENEILGYAWNEMNGDEKADCEIVALYVRYAKRNCGIGKALFLNSKDLFRAAGKKQMVIWCLKDNVEARKFYERMGGKQDETSTHQWGNKVNDMVSYLYPLNEKL